MSRPCLRTPRRYGRVPILVGGTGLYFKALTERAFGRAADPAGDPRRGARRAADARASAPLHAELPERDPATAHG